MAKAKSNQPELTGAIALFGKSKDIVLKNWKVFAVLYIFPVLVSVPTTTNRDQTNSSAIPGLDSDFWAMGIFVIILLAIVFVVLSTIIQAMLYVLEIQTSNGKQPTLSDVWKHTSGKIWKFVGLSLIVGLTIVAGFIAFIVPGVIFVRRYFLAPYYLLDKDLSISEAMKQSAAASKPYSGYVWSVVGVMSLLTIVPTLIPVFGGLISTLLLALYSVAPAIRYQELKKLS